MTIEDKIRNWLNWLRYRDYLNPLSELGIEKVALFWRGKYEPIEDEL